MKKPKAKLPEKGANFEAVVRRMLETPPTPHEVKGRGKQKTAKPK